MPEAKSISVSFRISPRFKQLLEAAAARERRSQTNMLESLLFAYCEEHSVEVDTDVKSEAKTRKGAGTQ